MADETIDIYSGLWDTGDDVNDKEKKRAEKGQTATEAWDDSLYHGQDLNEPGEPVENPYKVDESLQEEPDMFDYFEATEKAIARSGYGTTDGGPTPLGNLGIGDSKYDFKGGLSIPQALDIQDKRGREQTTGDKIVNGLVKFVGKTGVNVIGGTVGTFNGLYEAMRTGDASKLFNNNFSYMLDDWNEALDKKLPHYYSNAEREASFWQSVGTANFIFDKALNGFSFLTGAALTELSFIGANIAARGALSHLQVPIATSLVGRGANLFKKIDYANDAKNILSGLQKGKNVNRLWETTKLGRRLFTGANYEAGVEARHHYDSVKEMLIARKMEDNGGRELTDEELAEIENDARESANVVYMTNLALVGGSNMIMLGKLYGPGLKMQRDLTQTVRKFAPNFMKSTRVVEGVAEGASKSSRALTALRVPKKAQEVLKKGSQIAGKLAYTAGYEGIVEEGGQFTIDKAMYDYTRSKYNKYGIDVTGDFRRSFARGLYETFGTKEGQENMFLGALLSLIGIPGMGGNITATHGYIKSLKDKWKTEDTKADIYNDFVKKYGQKGTGLLDIMHHNADLMKEIANIQPMIDQAISEGRFADAKDLESDLKFAYAKVKFLTGQFEDVQRDAKDIRSMDNGDFARMMGYSSDMYTDEQISRRKNKVADNWVKYANQVRDSFDRADDILNFDDASVSDLTSESKTHLREWLAHKFSTLESNSEREAALTNRLAQLTNGKISKTADGSNVITYLDKNGNAKSFDMGAFSSRPLIAQYKELNDKLKEDANKPELERMPEEERKAMESQAELLRNLINTSAAEVDVANLTDEELDMLQQAGVLDAIGQLEQTAPEEALKNLKEIVQTVKDLRHIRSNRQELIVNLNNIIQNGSNALIQELDQLKKDLEDYKKEGGLENILDEKAKSLFRKYGTNVTFKVGGKSYKFTSDGFLIDEEGNVVDSSILQNVTDADIISPEREYARRVRETIKRLKDSKAKEAESITQDIFALKQKYERLLIKLANLDAQQELDFGEEFRNVGEVASLRDELRRQINETLSFINNREIEVAELNEQQDAFDAIINRYYDPETGTFNVKMDTLAIEEQEKVNKASAELGIPISEQENIDPGESTNPDLVEIDEMIKIARDPNHPRHEEVTKQMKEYGVKVYKRDTLYRIVNKAEVDNALSGERVSGVRGIGDYVDVSTDPMSREAKAWMNFDGKGTYRITFKDKNKYDTHAKGQNVYNRKTETTGWMMGGYTRDDIASIQKWNPETESWETIYVAETPATIDLNSAKKYAQKIKEALSEFSTIHKDSMDRLRFHLDDIIQQKKYVEKVLFNRVKAAPKFKNLNLKELEIQNFDDVLYYMQNLLAKNQEVLNDPNKQEALNVFLDFDTFQEYENYLSDGGTLGSIEAELKFIKDVQKAVNSNFLIKQKLNSLVEEEEEAKALLQDLQDDEMGKLDLALALLDAIKFQQAYDDIIGELSKLEQISNDIEQEADPELDVEQNVLTHENPPSSSSYGPLTDESNTERAKLMKPDLAYPGFSKTAGDLAATQNLLKTINKELELETDKNKIKQLEASKKVAEAQLRWFKTTGKLRSKQSEEKYGKLTDLKLMTVHSNNVPKSLEKDLENTFFDRKESKFIIGKSKKNQGAEDADIKVVLTDNNGTPIRTKDGKAIFTSLMTPDLENEKMGERFTNFAGVDQTALQQEWLNKRKEILQANENFLLPITGLSRGYGNLIFDELGNVKLFNVKGRAIEDGTEYKNAPIRIATQKDKNDPRYAYITLGHNQTLRVPPGFVYTELFGNLAPLMPRYLDSQEIEQIIRLIRKFEQNLETLSKQENARRADVLEDARTYQMEGHDILRLLEAMVFFGPITKEYDPQYRFFFDKTGWFFGEDGFISHDQILSNDAQAMQKLRMFLATKHHQINKFELDEADNRSFTMPFIEEDLTVDPGIDYANYKDYLLSEQEGRPAPLQTAMPPINDSEDAIEFNYVYAIFDADRIGTDKATQTEEKQDVKDLPFTDNEDYTPKQKASIKMSRSVIAAMEKGPKEKVSFRNAYNESMEGKAGKNFLDEEYFGLYMQNAARQDQRTESTPRAQYIQEIKDLLEEYESVGRDMSFPEWIKSIEERFVKPEKQKITNPGKKIKKKNNAIDKEDPSPTKKSGILDKVKKRGRINLNKGKSKNMLLSQAEYVDPAFAPARDIENLFKERAKALKMLPQQDVEFVTGFIKGNSPDIVAQVRERGKTLVSYLAPGGAVYHETFHQVEEFILDKEKDGFDRMDLYEDVRTLTKKNLTEDQASEYLAEEFRMITMDPNYKSEINDGPKDIVSRIKEFFRKLKALLKSFFGLDNSLEVIRSRERVAKLFNDIQAGKFAKRDWNLERKDKTKNMAYLPDGPNSHKSSKFTTDLMNALSKAFSDIMFYDPNNPIKITDLEMLANPVTRQQFSKRIADAYERAIALMQQELADMADAIVEDSELGESDPRVQAIIEDLMYIEDNQEAIIEKHREFLNTVGLDYVIEKDEENETDQGKDAYNEFSAISSSAITEASPIIKILMATLPSEEITSLGLQGVIDYHYAMKVLHKELADIPNIDTMWTKMINLKSKYPWVSELLHRVGALDTVEPNQIKLQTIFFDQFFKNQLEFSMYLDDLGENDIYPINPNKDTRNKQIMGQWRSNLFALREKSGLVNLDFGGFLTIRLDKKIKLPSLKGSRGLSIFEMQNDSNKRSLIDKNINTTFEFLEALGFTFTNKDAMISSTALINGKTPVQIVKEAAGYLIKELSPIEEGSNNAFADLFNPNYVDAQGKLADLIEAEMLFNTNVIELRHLGPDGKPRYGMILNNYFTLIKNILNNEAIPEHLSNSNPYAGNSRVLEAIKKGKKLQIGVIEGKTIKDYSAPASLTNQLQPGERFQMKFDMILRGLVPILRTADSKLDYYMKMPVAPFKNYADAKPALLGYFEDEVNVAQSLNLNGYGEKIAAFKDKAKGLRLFDKIMNRSTNKAFKSDLQKLLLGEMSLMSFYESYEDMVFDLIVEELTSQANDIKEKLISYRIVDRTGTGSFENNGLGQKGLRLFADKRTGYDTLSLDQLDKLTNAVALNWFVGVNEQLKLFFFDPALYDTFFKRNKGASGTGNHPRVDDHMLRYLNDKNEDPVTGYRSKRYDNKMSNGTANLIVTEDPITESVYAEDIKRILDAEYGPRDQHSDYAFINEADANAVSNIHFYRDILRSIGNEWSDTQEAAYQKLFKGGTLTDAEFAAVFPTQKFQFFGPQNIKGTERLGMMLKFTVTPVNPKLMRGTKLGDLISKMSEKNVDLLMHPSAAKFGFNVADLLDPNNRATPLYNNRGEFNSIPRKLIQNINLRHFKIQVKMAKPSKRKTSVSTQARSIIPTNLYEGGVPADINMSREAWNSLDEKGKREASELYALEADLNRATNGYTRNLYHKLLERFGFKLKDDGTYTLGSVDKLIEFMQNEMMTRKYPDDMVEGLNLILELKKQNADTSFDILTNKTKIESLLFSIIGKNAINQKLIGDGKTQISSMGFGGQARVVQQDSEGYLKLIGSSDYNKLNFYTIGEDGKTNAMGILVPHQFKEYFTEDLVIGKDGNIYSSTGQRVAGPELLEGIGLRIPVDDLHSIDFFVIKGFLPQNAGNIVVTPPEILVKQGSDNDGDKFTMYLPAYRQKVNGQIVKLEFIDGNTNSDATLKKLYKAKYGPTLEYFDFLEEKIQEATTEAFVRDPQTERTIQRLMEAIFGELAIPIPEEASVTPTRTYDILGLMDAFNNNDLDFVLKKFEQVKERMKEVPSEADWIKENKGKDIFLLNTTGAVQNHMNKLQKDVLSHPRNYAQLLNPVTTKQAKDIAIELRGMKGELLDKSQKSFADLFSFVNNEDVANEHWVGMDTLGITAVNFTSHRKFQKAGVFIAPKTEFTHFGEKVKPRLKFAGISVKQALNNAPIELGRIKDIKGNYISDNLAQIGNAFADVSKDAFVFDLNFTTKTANVLMYLLRAGIPVRTAALFLNQPIIIDLITELSVNDSRHIRTKSGKTKKRKDIIKKISDRYGKATKEQKTLFTDNQLEEMVKNRHNLTPAQKKHQLQILRDYLNYDAVGSQLANATISLNYDTTRPRSRAHARIMREQRLAALGNKNIFKNLPKVVENTHVGEFVKITDDSINLFSEFFLADNVDVREISGLDAIFQIFSSQDIQMSLDDRARILTLAENDLITAILGQILRDSTGRTLTDRIDSLFRGTNSIPIQAEQLRGTPLYRDNEFLKSLIPIIELNRDPNEQTTDNLKAVSRIFDTYQHNNILDAFKELPSDFQENFIEFAILQSGLSNNMMSLLKFVPNDMYVRKALQVARELKAGRSILIDNSAINNFFDNFFKNNYMNRNIVPVDWMNKLKHFPYHVVILSGKKGQEDTIILKAKNKDGIYVTVPAKGNKENLKEYSDGRTSLIEKNNKAPQPKSKFMQEAARRQSYFESEIASLKEEMRRRSKKCNK